jgi:hypothetical protein
MQGAIGNLRNDDDYRTVLGREINNESVGDTVKYFGDGRL